MDLSKFISLLSTIINQVVYRLKASSDSTYMKYKTRLVVCKNEQQHGLDFQKTFVPITKWSTIRCFIGYSTWLRDLHMDVNQPSLTSILKKMSMLNIIVVLLFPILKISYVN
jgi:hypothetical protein